jgi:hypothetical protein
MNKKEKDMIDRVGLLQHTTAEYVEKYLPLTTDELTMLAALVDRDIDGDKFTVSLTAVSTDGVSVSVALQSFIGCFEDDDSDETYSGLRRHLTLLSESEVVHALKFVEILLQVEIICA